MSTHSYIGVIEEDGTLKYVYCHSDGYPSYLGRMLLTYYNTPELATGLVNLGDLSMVRSMLRERLVPDKGKYHTFKNLSAKVRRVVSPPLIIVTGKNASTSTRPLLAGRISARMLKRRFWISPRATIFPMHICMISLKNSGLLMMPVRIADLRS